MNRGRGAPARTAAFDLPGFLERERRRVEAALERAVAGIEGDCPAVAEAARHAVLAGGKRLRPVLTVAAYRAAGGRGAGEGGSAGRERGARGPYDLGAAVELVHAYSLVHDDLPCMDDADLRRGLPATHRAHGVEAAVRAGALLIALAHLGAWRAAARLEGGEEGAREVVRSLAAASGGGGMVGGQLLDLLAEERTPGPDRLEEIHRRKTGALLEGALRVGARAADAPGSVVEALGRYGRHIGLAFQIADDVLDATATAEELGKRPSDRERGKSTYVRLHGLEGARQRASAEVADAVDALDRAGLEAPPLRALAEWVVTRRR